MAIGPTDAEAMGLPPRPFLYTLDQIATLLMLTEKSLRDKYVFYVGRRPGARPLDQLEARNIAPLQERPDWRVAERELLRFMRRHGFRIYERAWAK